MDGSPGNFEVTLGDLFRVLLRRWKAAFIVFCSVAVVGIVVIPSKPPLFSYESTVRVGTFWNGDGVKPVQTDAELTSFLNDEIIPRVIRDEMLRIGGGAKPLECAASVFGESGFIRLSGQDINGRETAYSDLHQEIVRQVNLKYARWSNRGIEELKEQLSVAEAEIRSSEEQVNLLSSSLTALGQRLHRLPKFSKKEQGWTSNTDALLTLTVQYNSLLRDLAVIRAERKQALREKRSLNERFEKIHETRFVAGPSKMPLPHAAGLFRRILAFAVLSVGLALLIPFLIEYLVGLAFWKELAMVLRRSPG